MQNSDNNQLPKKIWMYWDKGWDKAPELALKCKQSWEYYNPGWEIHCLDAESVTDYFDLYEWMPNDTTWKPGPFQKIKKSIHKRLHSSELIKHKAIKIPHQSDIIRLNLLKKYGGVWVDATLWCHKPLDSWLTPLSEGFFCFCNEQDPSRISNWFLASHKNNLIVDEMEKAVKAYWTNNNKAHDYLWFHGLFKELYENNQAFKASWQRVEKIDNTIEKSSGPHHFAPYKKEILEVFNQEYKDMVDSYKTPVFKLSNKDNPPLDTFKSIQYLFNTIKN